MLQKVQLLILLSVFALSPSQASAKEIRINFGGDYIGAFRSPPYSIKIFKGSVLFDTTDGTVTETSGTFTFVGPVSGGTNLGSISDDMGTVVWRDDTPPTFSFELYAPGYGYNSFILRQYDGFQQYGTCPSHCAFLGLRWAQVFDGVAPVPAPIAGSGLAGLVAFFLFGACRRLWGPPGRHFKRPIV